MGFANLAIRCNSWNILPAAMGTLLYFTFLLCFIYMPIYSSYSVPLAARLVFVNLSITFAASQMAQEAVL